METNGQHLPKSAYCRIASTAAELLIKTRILSNRYILSRHVTCYLSISIPLLEQYRRRNISGNCTIRSNSIATDANGAYHAADNLPLTFDFD